MSNISIFGEGGLGVGTNKMCLENNCMALQLKGLNMIETLLAILKIAVHHDTQEPTLVMMSCGGVNAVSRSEFDAQDLVQKASRNINFRKISER